MEFARVAKLRGHEVTLYEKDRLGGALNEAAVPEFKADIRPLTKSLINQVEKLGIPVINKADIEDLKDFDAVVVAVGGAELELNLPGEEWTMSSQP